MTSLIGLTSILSQLSEALPLGQEVKLNASSQSLRFLLSLACIRHASAWGFRQVVFVASHQKEAHFWYEHFASHHAAFPPAAGWQLGLFPSYSLWGEERFRNHQALKRQRLHALALLTLAEPQALTLIVTSPQALAQACPEPEVFTSHSLKLACEGLYPLEQLISQLEIAGYQSTLQVEEAGTFALRGGILDIFPVNHPQPLRLEFIGDQLASLRAFDPHSQRSFAELATTSITPAEECLLHPLKFKEYTQKLHTHLLQQECPDSDREGMTQSLRQGFRFSGFDLFSPLFCQKQASLCEYLDKQTLWLYASSQQDCLHRFEEFYASLQLAFEQDRLERRPSLAPSQHFCAPKLLADRLNRWPSRLELDRPGATQGQSPTLKPRSSHHLLFPHPKDERQREGWLKALEWVDEQEGRVLVFAQDDYDLQAVEQLCHHHSWRLERANTQSFIDAYPPRLSTRFFISLYKGSLPSYFWDEEALTLFLPAETLLQTKKRRKLGSSQKLKRYLGSLQELKPGELVVHLQHGIGRYLGLKQIAVFGHKGDFIHLEYYGGDKIYLPCDRLALLQRYQAGGGEAASTGPGLDRLRSSAWQQRKAKVAKGVKELAEQLLVLQAKRQLARPQRLEPAGELYRQFIEDFPYDETDDQLRAIEEVEADLASAKTMERIIVGDVGFGKTEVALRAAMRAVLSGYQVLVLVPTTVLCYQHEHSFRERLEKYGVSLGALNRFSPQTKQKSLLAALEKGQLDLLIGTHRLLSKDIKPRRLGLIIIDEEHKFGVSHKEKLKALKHNADVLSLSATPIPRTLHMAMIGLRDISVIASPPANRLATKTSVSAFDEAMVRQALSYEIKRGGQAFVVYNRIDACEEMCRFLQSLVPQAQIRFAHGQLPQNQLEDTIIAFIEQKFNILLCTTIIESGVDMPNANTLLVLDAERYGLAQLYQLRGRVGRAGVQAYAYFFLSPQAQRQEDAAKRLDILQTHQDLGSGFAIASADLDLRGAGNLLGGEQSGHMHAVGFELYTEMLTQVIQELAGKERQENIEPEIKIAVEALIPADYMPSESERLHYYKQLFTAETEDDIKDLALALKDRYGPLPQVLQALLVVAKIKQSLKRLRALKLLAKDSSSFQLQFAPLKEERIAGLIALARKKPTQFQLASDYKLTLCLFPKELKNLDMLLALSSMLEELENLQS